MLPPARERLPVLPYIPANLRNHSPVATFCSWFEFLWFTTVHEQIDSKGKNTRNVVKYTVAYFWLFLDHPVPPLPTGITNPQHLGNKEWVENLVAIARQGWRNYETFWNNIPVDIRRVQKLSTDSVYAFKKMMSSDVVTSAMLPIGPAGDIPPCFQPTKGPPLATRQELFLEKTTKGAESVATSLAKRHQIV
jgi:hypothetical protein